MIGGLEWVNTKWSLRFCRSFFLQHFLLYIFTAIINRFLQITMLSAYFVYLYKFNLNVCTAQVTLDVWHSCKLFRITTAMGATIGFSFSLTSLLCSFQKLLSALLVLLNSSNRWRLWLPSCVQKDVHLVQSLLFRDQSELKTSLTCSCNGFHVQGLF